MSKIIKTDLADILTKSDLKKILPEPFYDLYFNKQAEKCDNGNYIVGGKGIGKSGFGCLICIYNFTNDPMYNAILSRRIYEFTKNSKDQFRATLNFLDGAENNNGSHIERSFGIKPKRLSIQFEVPRTGNNIYFNQRVIKLLAYDKPDAGSSLQPVLGYFKEVFNDECVRFNPKEAKITIGINEYNKYISDAFRAKRFGIRNGFIYNPTLSNGIDEICVELDPYDEAKLEYIKKNGFSFVNEKRKNRNYNILRCSFLISRFNIEEIKADLDTKKELHPDYFLFEAYGKPLTKFSDGFDVYDVDRIRHGKKTDSKSFQYLKRIHIGFDWGKIDRCVMTFVGFYNYIEQSEAFERIVILKEMVIEFPNRFKNSLDVMDSLGKNHFCPGYKENQVGLDKLVPFFFYYQSNDYIIIDYFKKQLMKANLIDMFNFQKPIAKNEKGGLKDDKFRFMEYLIATDKLYYAIYPKILMKNLLDYQKDDMGDYIPLRDEDGFDAFIDTLIDVRSFIK